MDAVDRTVEIWSSEPQTEPGFFTYDVGSTKQQLDPGQQRDGYHFDQILPRLVPSNATSTRGISTRLGVLNIDKPQSGWAAVESGNTGSDGPWEDPNVATFGQLNFIPRYLELTWSAFPTIAGNHSVFFADDIGSDTDELQRCRSWIGDLYIAAKNRGNAALALQSVFTAVASNIFYDYLPKLDRSENVTVVAFLNVSSPGGPYGTRRGTDFSINRELADLDPGSLNAYVKGRFPVGYTIVAVLLGVQIILAMVILLRFHSETVLTRIGDSWQAVAQVASDKFGLDEILDLSRRVDADRTAVAKELDSKYVDKTCIGVVQQDGAVTLSKRSPSEV
ncbi:hypothetical protein AA313_de0207659 [Arthrobotrys entomopaga]|nr:hypothetical protein AA313_de0207659 [Arthrobotrys entomopaga]